MKCAGTAVVATALWLMISGCGPTQPSNTHSAEFEFCWQILDGFYIRQDSLPKNPYSYNTPQDLYASVHDRWTEYFDPQEAAAFRNFLTTENGGIGIWIDSVTGGYLIKQVFDGSPGKTAGLQPHDTIRSVDSFSVAAVPFKTFLNHLGGNIGDKRALGIKRGDTTVMISVTLGTYQAPSVLVDTLDSTAVRIILTIFTNSSNVPGGSAAEMHAALARTASAPNTILDIRHNTGGYLSQCFDIASEFLASNAGIIKLHQRVVDSTWTNGQWNYYVTTADSTYRVQTDGQAKARKLYVLVDDTTASASEILVSALEENRPDVTVVGIRTFGKGEGQIAPDTPLNGIAKVTSLLILQTSGASYNGIGLLPTRVIAPGEDALQVALAMIHGGLSKVSADHCRGRNAIDGRVQKGFEPLAIDLKASLSFERYRSKLNFN